MDKYLFIVESLLDLSFKNDYCLHMEVTTPLLRQQAVIEPRRVSSESLLGAEKELVIVHNRREYRLRLTQNDKLILTA